MSQSLFSPPRRGLIRCLVPLLILLVHIPVSAGFTHGNVGYAIESESEKTCYAYGGVNASGDIEIPEYVNGYKVIGIDRECFYGNKNITSVTLPSTLKSIGLQAFNECSSLKSVKFPENLEEIELETYAFAHCNSLEIINIPCPAIIRESAFYDCTSLRKAVLGGGLDDVIGMNNQAFNGCTLSPLVINGTFQPSKYNESFGLNPESYIICRANSLSEVKKRFNGRIYSFDDEFIITSIAPLICGFKIMAEYNPYYQGTPSNQLPTICFDSYNQKTEEIVLEMSKEIIIKNLSYGIEYTILFGIPQPNGGDSKIIKYTMRTKSPKIECDYKATQTTLTIHSITAEQDESVIPEVFSRNPHTGEEKLYSGEEITFTKLSYDRNYVIGTAYYNSRKVDIWAQTKPIYLNVNVKTGATSIHLTGSYDSGDAEVFKTEWYIYVNRKWHPTTDGDKVILTGLAPGTSIRYQYAVNYSTESKEEEIILPPLELNMLRPKGVSSTKTIVAAETNIDDIEASVGFQWKKYEAPASLAPNEGYAVVSEGVLEGYIRNLQPTSFYNVRAFYKDAEEHYYYSDWTTFDPSDFSFFEPTVRTYPTEEIGQNNATLRGYVLAGTDDIVSQGFQYWLASAPQSVRQAAAPSTSVFTVEAQGQLMSATLDGLRPGSEYRYRAFVQTQAGYKYGDEQSFETLAMSGVEGVVSEVTAPEIVGYYDLSGRRYTEPRRGLNIILYSDGTTRKEYVR